MSDTVITVDSLSKSYKIGLRERQGRTFRETATDTLLSPFRRLNDLRNSLSRPHALSPSSAQDDTFWALKDVSFEVKRGEVVGIIGRNGAGKSTLLKILSRITEPTSGEVRLRGRVASLLEVGTGFHPELTGRENIYLNGAILGMKRAEIARKFDEIVAFSEVEKFLDTPVKRYSSGMYVRLAFAVAAHLEPEILIVDEVLAVGDAEFQRKCLGKMQEVSKGQGRTVLFVSHNTSAVRALCGTVAWINRGELQAFGETDRLVSDYLRDSPVMADLGAMRTLIEAGDHDPLYRLEDLAIEQEGSTGLDVGNHAAIEVRITYTVTAPVRGLRVYFDLCDENQEVLVRSFHDEDADDMHLMAAGRYRSIAIIPPRILAAREYRLIVRATLHNVRCLTPNAVAIRLRVRQATLTNRAYPHEPCRAKMQPYIRWTTATTSNL